MTDQSDFYITRAKECARAAEQSALPLQRAKYKQAEAAWLALAKRQQLVSSAGSRRAESYGALKGAENLG